MASRTTNGKVSGVGADCKSELAKIRTGEETGKNAPHRLERTTFSTSRLLDFCSRKELIAQTGCAMFWLLQGVYNHCRIWRTAMAERARRPKLGAADRGT